MVPFGLFYKLPCHILDLLPSSVFAAWCPLVFFKSTPVLKHDENCSPKHMEGVRLGKADLVLPHDQIQFHSCSRGMIHSETDVSQLLLTLTLKKLFCNLFDIKVHCKSAWSLS